MRPQSAARTLAGRVVEVRHLGKHLHFCNLVEDGSGEDGSGASAAVQVCFELAAFGGGTNADAEDAEPHRDEEGGATAPTTTPFPDTKAQVKVGDRVELGCRLPEPGQSCTSGAAIPRVVWWRRAARPAASVREKPSKRAAKTAASFARAQQRLAWSTSLAGVPLLTPELAVRVGQAIGVPQRQRRVRRPQVPGTASLRLAEKDRDGTCPFADTVATLAVTAYRERCAAFDAARTEQTVVAAFLVHDTRTTATGADPVAASSGGAAAATSALSVVALGVGTKFMPAEMDGAAGRGCLWRVRDSHAEILARRSFLRYLYQQLQCCYTEDGAGSIFWRAAGENRCRLRTGVSFHLYSSTVPCGNASLARWATQSGAPTAASPEDDEGGAVFPRGHVQRPERALFSARGEGQLAALIKGPLMPMAGASAGEPEPEPQRERQPVGHTVRASVSSCDRRGTVPPGCSAVPAGADGMACVAGGPRYSLSCSDKIARWQCLGVQGNLLMRFLAVPLYLQSCTFGRKFNRQRCERAMCCRLQDFSVERCPELAGSAPSSAADDSAEAELRASRFRIHHAAMLGTGVLLDPDAVVPAGSAGTVDTGEAGAVFSAVCGAWAAGDADVAWHDGRTGRVLRDDAPDEGASVEAGAPGAAGQDGAGARPRWAPATASAALHEVFASLSAAQATATAQGKDGGSCEAAGEISYAEAKRAVGEATGYGTARRLLLFGGRTKLHRTLEGRGPPPPLLPSPQPKPSMLGAA